MIQYKLMAAGALVIGLTVWAGFVYVTNLQEKVEFQAGEITKFETANKTLTAERAQLEISLKQNSAAQTVLNDELREARVDKDRLIKLFSDHDFAKLVNAKPGLMTLRINKGTDRVFKKLEAVSDE